jgi:flagellin-like protein
MRKGISPLVATVLLIAATMSIAGILAYWASNFAKSALPEANSSQTTCQFADFQIYQCSYSNNTETISFVLYNYRTITLSSLRATIFDANSFPTWSNITLNESLPAGFFVGYSLTNIPSNFTKMVITTSMCPSLIHDTVEKPCARS